MIYPYSFIHFRLSPENTDVLTEIGVLYLKLNETQKAFDRLLEVIQFDRNCLRGLMAFGAILQVCVIIIPNGNYYVGPKIPLRIISRLFLNPLLRILVYTTFAMTDIVKPPTNDLRSYIHMHLNHFSLL